MDIKKTLSWMSISIYNDVDIYIRANGYKWKGQIYNIALAWWPLILIEWSLPLTLLKAVIGRCVLRRRIFQWPKAIRFIRISQWIHFSYQSAIKIMCQFEKNIRRILITIQQIVGSYCLFSYLGAETYVLSSSFFYYKKGNTIQELKVKINLLRCSSFM